MRGSLSCAALWVVSVLVGGCDRQDPAGPAEWGTLELVTLTEGLDPDPDGYVLQLDGISSLPLPASGTTTVPELTSGNHTVALSGVASQCYTEPALPQSLSIIQQELTRLTIQITCLRAYPLPADLAFAVTERGRTDSTAPVESILIMPAVGSGRHTVRIPQRGRDLRWSPDGTKLAFVGSTGDIYAALADGGDVRRLTSAPGADLDPRWSPDGTRILFTSYRDGNAEVYRMEVDGSGLVNLSNHRADDSQADWSPDGTRIVFVSLREDIGSDLYAMNVDGSNLVRLATGEDRGGTDQDPVWSPDGSEIAFWTQEPWDGSSHPSTMYRMNADGSDVDVVSKGTAVRPRWSPTGTRLLGYVITPGASLSDGPFSTVFIWDLTSGERTYLSEGWTPAWSPDEALVAFAHVPTNEQTGPVGIVSAGGGEVTDLFDFPIVEGTPAWRPASP